MSPQQATVLPTVQVRWAINRSAQTRRLLREGVHVWREELVGNIASLVRVVSMGSPRQTRCVQAEIGRMFEAFGQAQSTEAA